MCGYLDKLLDLSTTLAFKKCKDIQSQGDAKIFTELRSHCLRGFKDNVPKMFDKYLNGRETFCCLNPIQSVILFSNSLMFFYKANI